MKLCSAEREEYLKLIDQNQDENGFVRNNELAKQLKLASSSITEMFFKLSQEGLILYTPYKGAKLTGKGKVYVRQLRKKQQLLRYFFEVHLNCTKNESEDILDHLEHIDHKLFFEKLEIYLDILTIEE